MKLRIEFRSNFDFESNFILSLSQSNGHQDPPMLISWAVFIFRGEICIVSPITYFSFSQIFLIIFNKLFCEKQFFFLKKISMQSVPIFVSQRSSTWYVQNIAFKKNSVISALQNHLGKKLKFDIQIAFFEKMYVFKIILNFLSNLFSVEKYWFWMLLCLIL